VVASRLGRSLVAIRRRAVMVADAVRDLYRAHWGEPSRQARFEVGELGIEILKWDSDGSPEGVNVYATVGASCRPLAGREPGHRIEFFVGLLPERDDIASALAALGLYAAREDVALDHGHTVPADGPLWSGSPMDAFLVMRPTRDFLPALELPDGVHVEFLQAIPIFESDRAFKVEHGADALMRRWEDIGVPFWNPDRSDALID
jgi:hypothetical protein